VCVGPETKKKQHCTKQKGLACGSVAMLSSMLLTQPSAFLVDKDGTLVHQGAAVDGAAEFVEQLLRNAVPHVVLSNTGEKDAPRVAEDLTRTLGVRVDADHVHTALDEMRARVHAEHADADRRVRVVGDPFGAVVGVPRFDATEEVTDEEARRTTLAVFSDGHLAAFCETVTAAGAWLSRGASLWITSADRTVATCLANGDVRQRPGPGIVLEALLAVAPGCRDVRVFGKGGNDDGMGHAAMRMLRAQGFTSANDRHVMIVGDRLDTDVRVGAKHGWTTCLVESGCHTLADTSAYPSDTADLVARSVRDLARVRPAHTVGELVSDLLRDVVRALLRRVPQCGATWMRVTASAGRYGAGETTSCLTRRVRSHSGGLDSLA
jgi:NagD protein